MKKKSKIFTPAYVELSFGLASFTDTKAY